MDRWCRERELPRRPLIQPRQLWELSVLWYGDRLSPEAERPDVSEFVAIFASVGLVGPFWDPEAR